MPDIDYLIIGGGVAGIASFQQFIEKGASSVMLLEGRSKLMYSLTWMKRLTFSADRTGFQFREKILGEIEHFTKTGKILKQTRVFNIDINKKTAYARSSTGEKLSFHYNTLILAVGATQIVYGKYLLPGVRPGRIFTTYQVGEMLEHYPFLPGKKLIIFGESEYALETAIAARERGIHVTLVTPFSSIRYTSLENIKVYENCILKQVLGDVIFSGLLLQKDSKEFCIGGDSFAVDGDFVLEHSWRKLLGVEWNLDNWQLDLSEKEMIDRHLIFTGDAYKPKPDFEIQYRLARQRVTRILEGVKNVS